MVLLLFLLPLSLILCLLPPSYQIKSFCRNKIFPRRKWWAFTWDLTLPFPFILPVSKREPVISLGKECSPPSKLQSSLSQASPSSLSLSSVRPPPSCPPLLLPHAGLVDLQLCLYPTDHVHVHSDIWTFLEKTLTAMLTVVINTTATSSQSLDSLWSLSTIVLAHSFLNSCGEDLILEPQYLLQSSWADIQRCIPTSIRRARAIFSSNMTGSASAPDPAFSLLLLWADCSSWSSGESHAWEEKVEPSCLILLFLVLAPTIPLWTHLNSTRPSFSLWVTLVSPLTM